MKEITVRIYTSDDESLISAIENHSRINYFDLYIDGEVYSNMRHLTLDVHAPEKDERGELHVDNTKVSMVIEKDFFMQGDQCFSML